MPCLSRSVFRLFSESTSVSKALSQVALPLAITTFFAARLIGSPKGSAVLTGGVGAGVCAAAGGLEGAGDGLGADEGPVLGAGEGLAETAGAGGTGDCAETSCAASRSAAAETTAAKARRNKRKSIYNSPRPTTGPAN